MEEDEEKKLRKLLKERAESGSLGKLDWMYKGNKTDPDEYLLGKRVDKNFTAEDEPPPPKDAPGATFTDVIARRADLDMQTKMREDPLYQIRQKEEDARKRLLNNPIKMKRLQQMVEATSSKKKKKEKKKKKKKEVASSDEEDDLMAQYLKVLRKKQGQTEQDKGSHPDKSHKKWTSKEESKKHEHRTEKTKHAQSPERYSDKNKYRSPERKRRKSVSPARNRRKSRSQERRRKSRSPEMRRRHSRSPQRDKWRSRSSERGRRKSRSRSPHRRKKSNSPTPLKADGKKKMSADELERKRQQMIENARWRDEQRASNVKRYQEEEAAAQKKAEAAREKGDSFINPMMAQHAEQSSVEDRIKRNIYNIQRTQASLEKNFSRK